MLSLYYSIGRCLANAASYASAQTRMEFHDHHTGLSQLFSVPRCSRSRHPWPLHSGIRLSIKQSVIEQQGYADQDCECDTYRLSMPPVTTKLKPAQMPSSTCGTHDHIRVLPDLLIRYGFITGYRIIPRMQTKRWSSYGQHGIRRTRVTIICSYCRVSPCGDIGLHGRSRASTSLSGPSRYRRTYS